MENRNDKEIRETSITSEHLSRIEQKIDKHISVERSLLSSFLCTLFLYTMLYYFSPAHKWGLENLFFYGEITFIVLFMLMTIFGELIQNVNLELVDVISFDRSKKEKRDEKI